MFGKCLWLMVVWTILYKTCSLIHLLSASKQHILFPGLGIISHCLTKKPMPVVKRLLFKPVADTTARYFCKTELQGKYLTLGACSFCDIFKRHVHFDLGRFNYSISGLFSHQVMSCPHKWESFIVKNSFTKHSKKFIICPKSRFKLSSLLSHHSTIHLDGARQIHSPPKQ